MAEGGIYKSPAKPKPVPPPKPIGTVVTSSRSGLRKSVGTTKISVEGQSNSSLGIETEVRNVTSVVGEHVSEVSPMSSPQTSKIFSKPPLLPKPHLANFQSKRQERSSIHDFHGQTLPSIINSASGVIRKPPSKLFIPSPKVDDGDNRDNTKTIEVKAPVAKLDEFDHVGDQLSPVRPPRSPKHKSLVGGPFLTEAGRRQQFHAIHQMDINTKSASLGRNIQLPAELRTKSNSLGRNLGKEIAQVVENSGSSFTECETRSPVRPPRRRNKSVTLSPEVSSPSPLEDAFDFENVQSTVPVYAQVNYELKKNRRSKETASLMIETQGGDENVSSLDLETVERIGCEMVCADGSELESDDLNEMPMTLCSINSLETEDCESETKEEVVDSDYTYLSFASSKINFNQFHGNSVVTNEGIAVQKSVIDTCDVCPPKSQKADNDNFSILSQMCSESCADCLPVQILERSFDDSISSSKLDWQSVRSSFNSSDSDVAVEVKNLQLNQSVSGETVTLSDQNAVLLSESSEIKSDLKEEVTDLNNDISSCEKQCSIHNEFLCKCETDSSNLSGISGISDIQPELPVSEKRRHYKRLTSSLPIRKACKKNTKDPRRQSWTGYKDSAHYGDWKSSWLDEGDSSSGNMGDLDSSDNAVKQSSGEEVDSKSKSDQSVSRRFNLWLSSFGKSGKKNRNVKRHSHFYCERQGSTVGDAASKDSVEISGPQSPSVGISGSLSSEVSSSCSFISAPSSQLPYSELTDKVASEESIASDLQSDSDGEGEEGSYDERNQSRAETLQDGKKAFYIANELMTSEQVFIKALKLLNVDFRQAVQKTSSHGHPVISPVEFDKILNSLPQLQRLNEDLLCDLEERIQNWSSLKKIADVIVKKGPFLKLYTTYIQNFEAQCNYFDECCQKYPKFAKAVREFEASSVCQKLSVKHYMLKPVQRIPQYRLLLDDYSRHQHPSSPDFEDTQIALKIVCEVADHANRSIKLGDHFSVLLQLQSQLGNYEIIKPGRVLLKDGELYKLSRKERQPRYFILLNDCLLYTSYYGSGPSSGLKVNSELSLGGMKVTIPQAEDYHNEFSIISSTRSFTLSARSSSERQKWVEALQNAIEEYTSRQRTFQVQKLNVARPDGSCEPFKLGKEAPIWIQDGRVTKCQLCVAEFTVTFRRHHCRACGKVVCGICSAYRAPLQYMKFQSDRVCEDCFNTLLREFDTPGNKIADVIKAELGRKRCDQNTLGSIRSQFKRLGPSSGKKTKKHIPQRLLEVTANDAGSQMCGWLQRRSKRSWKRLWFVLKEQVLYVYKASEDVVALETIPVLGYKVEPMKQIHFQLYEGIDAKLVFQLAHPNQQPLVFSADSENLVKRWIAELQEATILK